MSRETMGYVPTGTTTGRPPGGPLLHRQHLAAHLHAATPPHRTHPDAERSRTARWVGFALVCASGAAMVLAIIWAFHALAGV